ncbi:AAA family ATPase [Rummeliibacillus sp. NPDC094406]|uniref:ATP-binding protein n=1 Tax=Rummeliibacillus sp. NPDC094406 TaxID=3364511 RepID=UPI0038285B37
MNIRKLVIYGFGQHEDITVELSKGINVFYGLNEVGKTTIQQFILQILFGFPQKNQQQLRYEPKKGGKYGGQIHLTDQEFGDCIIERVKGKAAGDVTVYLSNGEQGHEELLAKIVRGYNRQSFEAVFSFSVHQLQQIENLSEEELSRVLLASGTTGADQLSNVKEQLEKRQQELFKKSGKVPLLNQQIASLVKQDQQLKEERKKLDSYEPSMERINEIQTKLVYLQEQEQQLQIDMHQLNEFRQIAPLLDEKRKLELKISSISYTSFPANGINRYEQLQDRKLTNEATLKKVQYDYDLLLSDLRAGFDKKRLNILKELVDRDGEWREWQIQIRQIEREIQAIQQDMKTQFQLLGLIHVDEQQSVLQAEVSLQQEDQFKRLIKQLEEQEEQYRFQQRTADRLQEEIQSLSLKLDELYEDMPTEKDKERLNEWHKEKEAALEAKAILQQQNEKGPEQLAKLLSIVLAVISIILGITQEKMMVSIIGIVAAIIIFSLFGRQNKHPKNSSQQEKYERKIQRASSKTAEMDRLEQSIRQYDDRIALVEEQLEDKEMEQQQAAKALSKLKMYVVQSKEQLNLFLAKFQIKGNLQPELLSELFRNVRELQQSNSRMITKSEQRTQLLIFIEQRLQEATNACSVACTMENLSTVVQQGYQQMLEQKHAMDSSLERKKQLQQQLEELQLLDDAYRGELLKLLKEAGVQTSDAFYEAADQYTQFMNTTLEIKQIDAQLQMFDNKVLLLNWTIQDANNQVNQYKVQELELQQQKDVLIKEQATLQAKTEHLLQDDHYGNELQKFEQKKAALNENAKEWAITKLISSAIQETLYQLKEEKLPSVLLQAESFFKMLTNNRYETLYMNTEGRFEVLSVEGIRYSIAELSQATKEQSYIALRYALANSLKQSAPFPIIMDDPFVHFDRLRITYMVQLIQSIAVEHQILYFTCHEDMQDQWDKANIIHVAELKNERGLTSV